MRLVFALVDIPNIKRREVAERKWRISSPPALFEQTSGQQEGITPLRNTTGNENYLMVGVSIRSDRMLDGIRAATQSPGRYSVDAQDEPFHPPHEDKLFFSLCLRALGITVCPKFLGY